LDRFLTPRRLASSRARDDPPGRPRAPLRRAESMLSQVSPGLSATGPETVFGQPPVRLRWESAQARIRETESRRLRMGSL
jgi:hypothetical protein